MHSKKYCKTSDRFTARFIALVLLMTAFAVYLVSCASFDHLTTTTPQFTPAAGCGKCHIEIYSEWSQSSHAEAYTNYHYSEATKNYSNESCLGCHAPQPTVSSEPPTVRSTNRDDGVTCVSCHLKEGILSGPLKPTGMVKPHPIDVDPTLYKSSDMCGRCHEGTFAQWKAVEAEEKETCQHCHMPSVHRKVTQSTGLLSKFIVAFEHKVPQGRHIFAMPSAGASSDILSATAKKEDNLATVTIRNNLPHSLPTGDHSDPTLLLEAYTRDANGNENSLGQRDLAKKLKTAIPAHETIKWRLKMPPDSTLGLRLLHLSHDGDITNLADVQVLFQ